MPKKTRADIALEKFQQCAQCESTCDLEGMYFHCFTWTCDECATDGKCGHCKRKIY